jgi:hypothetical protein
MLQLKNNTPLKAMLFAAPDPEGVDSVYTIVKGTFRLSEPAALTEEQVAVQVQDEYEGKPGESSLSVPTDVSLMKPGTDVLLCGKAYAPGGRPATEMNVGLAAGPLRMVIRVTGDRVWAQGAMGASISSPAAFETMPLVWERAYGGADPAGGPGSTPIAEDRNPVGAGFFVKGGKQKLDGMRLPNLENPKEPISSWQDRPAPVNFGPICPHWDPRRTYAGTYDAEWQAHRAPFLPKDFDPKFFQLAPPGLVAPAHFTGGEAIDLVGVTPAGRLSFRLPTKKPEVVYLLDEQKQSRAAVLDTVLLQPDAGRFLLVWRAVLRCDKKVLRVREVRVDWSR